MDLKERLAELASRNAEPLGPPTDEQDLKDAYLGLIEDGMFPEEAARELSKTNTWFTWRRSQRSSNFDAVFAAHYEQIMEDGTHQRALVGRVRIAMMQAIEKKLDVRAMEKILATYDPAFQWMRPVAGGGNNYIQTLVQIAPNIPTPLLNQLIEALESGQRELPEVIDV